MRRRGSKTMAQQAAEISQTIVPKTRGDLHDSMRIVESRDKTTIRYGGAAAPHAISAHERNYRYTRGRRWKYLAAAMRRVSRDSGAGRKTGGEMMDELISLIGRGGGGLGGFRPYSPRWWRN